MLLGSINKEGPSVNTAKFRKVPLINLPATERYTTDTGAGDGNEGLLIVDVGNRNHLNINSARMWKDNE